MQRFIVVKGFILMINDDDEFSAILEIYYDSLRFSGNSTRLPRTRISFLYSFFFFFFFPFLLFYHYFFFLLDRTD